MKIDGSKEYQNGHYMAEKEVEANHKQDGPTNYINLIPDERK